MQLTKTPFILNPVDSMLLHILQIVNSNEEEEETPEEEIEEDEETDEQEEETNNNPFQEEEGKNIETVKDYNRMFSFVF
ncbi:MAG: hypothetical protein H7Y00_06800 [Fimbriimonadaceae bacterium]|nr:hypothetical protein [Chitinophagales bacterium]